MDSIENKEVFSQNLRRYMDRLGKSQKEIAESVGVATSTFSDWMKGKKYPRIDKIEMLANLFGVKKSDLIEQQKEKPANNDGLTKNQRALIDFARNVPDEKAEKVLRLLQAILEADQ